MRINYRKMKPRLRLADVILLFVVSVSAAYAQAQAQATGGRDITFQIQTKLEFKGRTVSGTLRHSEIEKLLDLPVRNGVYDPSEGYGVEMTRRDFTTLTVYTCRESKKARADNAYAATRVDVTMESSFIDTCGLLFELEKARPPAKSFVANPKVSLANLDLLPAKMLNGYTDDAENQMKRLRGLTVSKVVPREDIEQADDKGLTLNYGNFRQSFWEGAHADFNGDGIEDILVFTGG